VQPRYGASVITALARIGGRTVAIVANDGPWVPLAHPMVMFATRAGVHGLAVQPSAMALYRGVERAP